MHPLCDLALSAVKNYLETGAEISAPADFLREFTGRKAGVFVTIEKKGSLRACMGTYLPCCKNIAKETIRNSIMAASEDYRFGPVKKEELPDLIFTVYVLSELELAGDFKKLNPEKYGIIVTGAERGQTGLLLPGLEGISDAKNQIRIACAKAGINPSKEKINLYKFTVEKYQ